MRLAIWTVIAFVLSINSTFAEEHVVDQKKLQFIPNEITIAAGDTIRFTNSDRTAHHLMTKDGDPKVSSPLLPPRKEYKIDFPVSGVFTIGCHIHPKMNLKITVK